MDYESILQVRDEFDIQGHFQKMEVGQDSLMSQETQANTQEIISSKGTSLSNFDHDLLQKSDQVMNCETYNICYKDAQNQDSNISNQQQQPQFQISDLPRPGIGLGVMIFNEMEEVLVSQRLEPGKIGHLKFQFPGGHIEHGESFQYCSMREVYEEAGVILPENRIQYMTTLNMIEPEHNYHFIGIIMFIHVSKNEFPFENQEPNKQTEWQWIKWEELINYENLFTPFRHLRDQGYADVRKIKKQFGLVTKEFLNPTQCL
eukprot:403358642